MAKKYVVNESYQERVFLFKTKISSHGYDSYLYTPSHSKYALHQIHLSVQNALQLNVPQHEIMQFVQKTIELQERNKTSYQQQGM